jgi:hypothetical protein
MTRSPQCPRALAGWRLRLIVLTGILVLYPAASASFLVREAARSQTVADLATHAAGLAVPLLPRGGFEWHEFNRASFQAERPSGTLSRFASRGFRALALSAPGAAHWPIAHILFVVATSLGAGALLGRRVRFWDARCHSYFLRVSWRVALATGPVGVLLFAAPYPVRFFWSAALQQSGGLAWVDLGALSRAIPTAGSALLYALIVAIMTHRFFVSLMQRDLAAGIVQAGGPSGAAGLCLSCGYEVGKLAPCPECGATEPRPTSDMLTWHSGLIRRWRAVLIGGILVGVCCWSGPLVVGTARALTLMLSSA